MFDGSEGISFDYNQNGISIGIFSIDSYINLRLAYYKLRSNPYLKFSISYKQYHPNITKFKITADSHKP